jgi:hypothetical protein
MVYLTLERSFRILILLLDYRSDSNVAMEHTASQQAWNLYCHDDVHDFSFQMADYNNIDPSIFSFSFFILSWYVYKREM